jgi:hypothetical protein
MLAVKKIHHSVLILPCRFHAESSTPVEYEPPYTLKDMLYNIIDRNIPVSLVVADRVMASSKEASDVIQMLSSAAADMNLMQVLIELGKARNMGSYPDPLAGVDEVLPVLRSKVRNFQSSEPYVYHLTDIIQLLATRHGRRDI